jgi:hypothetical protein
MDHDLNTKMENYCVTCQGRADQHRRQASTARAQPAYGNTMAAEISGAEAKKNDFLANRWSVRADYAQKGMFAVHSDKEGVVHQTVNHDLRGHADREFRSVYLGDDDKELDANKTI